MPPSFTETYLDIETTGLSPVESEITVIGIYHCGPEGDRFVQLVGREITAASIGEAVAGAGRLHTYNGSRFDLPFIAGKFGVDLARSLEHRDLMYDCWQCSLYGGLKAVEKQLGIRRRLAEMDGYQAIRLWWRYVDYDDRGALARLLAYNKEDVLNLKQLKEKLPG